MIGFALLVLGILGQFGLGYALAVLLPGGKNRGASRTELYGLGIVLGLGATSYLQFVWSLAGGMLGRPLSVGVAIGGCTAGIGAEALRRTRAWRAAAERPDPPPPPLQEGKSAHEASPVARASLALILVLFGAMVAQTLLTPQRLWDERAIYGLKAAVLFEDRTVHSADLAHPDFVQYHPRYPLLLPLAEQHLYALLGAREDRWAKLLPPVLYLGLVLAFAGVLSRHMAAAIAWLFALLLATVPVLAFDEYAFLSAQADAPVAAFHGAAVLYLWDWLRSGERPRWASLVVAAVFAGLAMFVKDEGIAFWIVDALALVAIARAAESSGAVRRPPPAVRRWLRRIGAVGVFALLPLALMAPWFWHRSYLPATTEMGYFERVSWSTFAAGAAGIGWSVRHLFGRMFFEPLTWGMQWWAMLAAFVARPLAALRREQLLLVGDVVGALAALIVAGMLAPTPVEEHLGGSSQRYLMQLVPVAVLFVAGQCRPPTVRRPWANQERLPERVRR